MSSVTGQGLTVTTPMWEPKLNVTAGEVDRKGESSGNPLRGEGRPDVGMEMRDTERDGGVVPGRWAEIPQVGARVVARGTGDETSHPMVMMCQEEVRRGVQAQLAEVQRVLGAQMALWTSQGPAVGVAGEYVEEQEEARGEGSKGD